MDQAIAIGFTVPAIATAMCAIFLCFWHYNREDRAALVFAAAFVMCAVGFLLNHFILAKESVANAIGHNACYAAGLYLLGDGIHRAFEKQPPRLALITLGAFSVIAAGIIQLSFVGLSVRIITINFVHGLMLMVTAWSLRDIWNRSWTGTAVLAALALCIINFILVSPITVTGNTIRDETFFQSAYWQIINLISIFSVLGMGGALVSVCVMQRLDALRDDAESDFLTGLKSRRAFEQAARHYCEARSGDYAASVIIIDLDHFKNVNDAYGHAVGDKVIRGVGALLSAKTRMSDMAGRMGGEEFCLVLPGTDMSGAKTLGERLRRAISELPMEGVPEGLKVTASFGVAELGRDMLFEDVYPIADAALYAAKSLGRNRVECAELPSAIGKPVHRKKLKSVPAQDPNGQRLAS
ncbi:GGDEF domain-containing protein [Henriciella barbarensis]|uniref:diguanylate cyclase n=1 Tax=Henriciella barbarensis TaxID=86342 RepID=A0A399QTP1_9PROT|nr:GGDEF domain-containing protein [Henriciella barbarensis]RIJ21614.1 GGDEF domain-containing protein [Henriciella barbarensis]